MEKNLPGFAPNAKKKNPLVNLAIEKWVMEKFGISHGAKNVVNKN